jgi:hypothetical protein
MVDEPNDKQVSPPALSERLQKCLVEIQTLVRQGVEHPSFEFKRTASLAREDLDDRLDFIKFLQGVANSEASEERCVVIGADPTEKQFYAVTNAAEFDPARVSPVLAKYLDPVPNIEIFNNLQTDDGRPLVVFIFNAVQPRPIVVKTEGKKADGKTRLQVGDIWIKKGTALQLISRVDLDLMYRQRMEEEAEDRARKRFKHFTEISGPSQFGGAIPTRMPVRELLVGPSADFRRFVEELLAVNDQARFSMLIELIRESLVEGWSRHDIRRPLPQDLQEYATSLSDFFLDEFLPSVQALVSLGLLIIKYDLVPEWLQSVINILTEAFEESRALQRLKSEPVSRLTGTLQWWRPAFEIYVAMRCIAVYAVTRDRPKFLALALQRFVNPVTIDDRSDSKTPILYWPLPGHMLTEGELLQGRSAFFWKERISTSWGSYFGTYEKFIASSCQLELLLEFNSYLATNSHRDIELQKWLDVYPADVNLVYVPDLYSNSLELTVPMAERCYDLVAAQNQSSPSQYEVLPMLFAAAFKNKPLDQRLFLYAEFLDDQKTLQARTMMKVRRFPFMFTWQGRLANIIEKYREHRTKKQ